MAILIFQCQIRAMSVLNLSNIYRTLHNRLFYSKRTWLLSGAFIVIAENVIDNFCNSLKLL